MSVMLSQKMDNITVVIPVPMNSPTVEVAPMMDAVVAPNSITLRVDNRSQKYN